jgi:hypothetical protein
MVVHDGGAKASHQEGHLPPHQSQLQNTCSIL